MASFTITTDTNIDALASKAGGDTYAISGAKLTIDQDTRYGLNNTTASSLPSLPISATLGGTVSIDATLVRLIPFTSGSGVLPALNTAITQGSASGKLIGVYSALNTAPLQAGGTMPATGWVKIKQWNGIEYSAGALSGLTATSSGASVVGFIEVVGDEAGTCTVPRLGKFEMKGAWFEVGTTNGVNTNTYQIPTNGSITYIPSVWVETGSNTNVYESYPCAGSLTALLANVATDEVRGKVCWISTAGVLRFQHDGTNATGGYLPPSGRRIRIPNIITANCTTAARTANVLPNATLTTRYDWTVSGGGVVEIDKACINWSPVFTQAYSIQMSNCCIAENVNVAEIASSMTWNNVVVGQLSANAQFGLTMSLCFAGGTFTDCKWTSATLGASGRYVVSISDISGFTFVNDKSFSLVARGNATSGNATITRASNCTWTSPLIGVGRRLLITCSNLSYTNVIYYDHPSTTTATANPMFAFDLSTQCTNITIDGVSFGGLVACQPYSGIMSVNTAGNNNIKLRNIGTPSVPLSMGTPPVYGSTWTRATTTATMTTVAPHSLKVNDIIYVIISSDVAAITVAAKTVATVPTTTTCTFTCLGAGAASGTLSWELQMSAYLVSIATSAAANNIRIQRCYTPQLRTGLWTSDNSSKNIMIESCIGTPYLGQVSAHLNGTTKNIGLTHTMSAQTAVYGTHWFDSFIWNTTPNLSTQSWARTTSVATVTSNNHRLMTGAQIVVKVTSDASAIVLGQKSITVTGQNTFTFTCLNAGGASGTLTYTVMNGRIGILANEATSDTASQYTIDSGTPAFTSAGGLYMPTIGQQVTFVSPDYIIGHKEFPIIEAVMAGGTIANHDIAYALDYGTGYGNFHNLYYSRAGGSGTSGQYTFTVTSAVGVEIGDYVWGTGINTNAQVTNISTNTITVDIPNTATVSGVIRFNHIPYETTTIPTTGIKIKIRIKTTTTNTAAITSLYIPTFSDDTTRAYQYVLDSVATSLSLTGLQSNSEIRIYRASDGVELGFVENSTTSFVYNYTWTANVAVNIIVHNVNYEYLRYDNYTLTSAGGSIPVVQRFDRNYNNPA